MLKGFSFKIVILLYFNSQYIVNMFKVNKLWYSELIVNNLVISTFKSKNLEVFKFENKDKVNPYNKYSMYVRMCLL